MLAESGSIGGCGLELAVTSYMVTEFAVGYLVPYCHYHGKNFVSKHKGTTVAKPRINLKV